MISATHPLFNDRPITPFPNSDLQLTHGIKSKYTSQHLKIENNRSGSGCGSAWSGGETLVVGTVIAVVCSGRQWPGPAWLPDTEYATRPRSARLTPTSEQHELLQSCRPAPLIHLQDLLQAVGDQLSLPSSLCWSCCGSRAGRSPQTRPFPADQVRGSDSGAGDPP